MPGEVLPLEVGRGCIFSCAFCSFDLIGKRVGDWTKSPKVLRNELLENYEKFGVTTYNFTDELINEIAIKRNNKCLVLEEYIKESVSYITYNNIETAKHYFTIETLQFLLQSFPFCHTFLQEILLCCLQQKRLSLQNILGYP